MIWHPCGERRCELSGVIHDMVITYLWELGWDHEDEEALVRFTHAGEHGTWEVVLHCRDEVDQLVVLSMVPGTVAEDRRTAMAEFLTRANCKLPIGNFEMSFDSGEVRFRTSVDVEDTMLDPAMLDNLVTANLAVIEFYLPGIDAMHRDGAVAAEEVARVDEED